MQVKLKSIHEIIPKYDHFVFDMDGVFWIGNQIIESGVKAAQLLISSGKSVYFLTNNSTQSRQVFLDKLRHLKIESDLSHVYTSSYLAAVYVHVRGHKMIYNMGMTGISDECKSFGVEVVESTNFRENEQVTYDVFESLNPSRDIAAVVTGYNQLFNYKMLCFGSKCVENGAELVAANPDSYIKVGEYKMPAGGCVQAIMEKATGKAAKLVGKPSPTALDLIMQTHKIAGKDRILMIGDNPETDIEFGRTCGIDTLLVGTGVTPLAEAHLVDSTYVCEHLCP